VCSPGMKRARGRRGAASSPAVAVDDAGESRSRQRKKGKVRYTEESGSDEFLTDSYGEEACSIFLDLFLVSYMF
jgi:hypothetical protein